MFEKWRKKALQDENKQLKAECEVSLYEATRSKEELRKVKDQLEDLKLKKKIEAEDIKHMIKMKEERNAVDNERKGLELEREKDKAVARCEG